MIGIEALREVPLPTTAQRARFIKHMCGAHSWYKAYKYNPSAQIHFAVFLWRGACFAPQHCGPDYHELFGFLAYGWRHALTGSFFSDGEDVELEPELLAAAGIVLEPYVSSNRRVTTGCILSYYRNRIGAHPRREILEKLVGYAEEQGELWSTFSEDTREAVFQHDRLEAHGSLPNEPGVARYLHVKQLLRATYQSLHAEEVAKIQSAIDRVCALRHTPS